MPVHFDPYHQWLSIPPKDQPPDHYRLLGLARFEGDAGPQDKVLHATRKLLCGLVLTIVIAANLVSAPTVAATIYVSPSGDDSNTGDSIDQALKNPGAAVARASAGTTVYFDAGTYRVLWIKDKNGEPGNPIVFQALPGKERQATFTTGSYERGHGIAVTSSSYIEIRNLRVTKSQKGINCQSVSHGAIQDCIVEDVGEDGVHVGRLHVWGKFEGPPSEHFRIIGNVVKGTGKAGGQNGEGLYIGTGFRGDDTHDILIEGNRLSDIRSEGMELKQGTYNITVRGNMIWNTHHDYNGAITIAAAGTDTQDGNYLIEDNLIWDIHQGKGSVGGIIIGHGNAIIRNNMIWGIEGGRGIRIYDTFHNPKALSITIHNNTVCAGPGGRNIAFGGATSDKDRSPLKANVQVKNTYTSDGSAGSVMAIPSLFAGPFTGNADAGRGPGSGFRLKRYRGIGADYNQIRKQLQPESDTKAQKR